MKRFAARGDAGGSAVNTLRLALIAFLLFIVPLSAQAACTSPAADAGKLVYNSSESVLQYCDGTDWRSFRKNGSAGGGGSDPCDPVNSPTAGQVCDDGSVYAGDHPTTSEPLFVPPADNGGVAWNNGNFSGYTTTNVTSTTDGQSNTATLITLDSDSGTAGTQQHQAAHLCADLSAHGHDDWYLPAKDELNVLYTNRVAIGGFDTSGFDPLGEYWSSREANNSGGWYQRFSDGYQWGKTKGFGLSVRCARQGYIATAGCGDPAGSAGDIRYNGDDNVLQWCDGATWHAAGPVPGAGGAGCSGPAAPAGRLIYNTNYKVPQYCDGTNWRAMGKVQPPSDPCAGTPDPGDVCADGTIYAGSLSGTKLFVPPADNSSGVTWNNGTSNWTVTGATSMTDGPTNTATLDGLSDAGSPHEAAKLCANLSAHGHSDWYLPAKDELNVLYTNRVAIGGFNTSGSWPSGFYWSSSEDDNGNAWYQRFSNGIQNYNGKLNALPVRCARH